MGLMLSNHLRENRDCGLDDRYNSFPTPDLAQSKHTKATASCFSYGGKEWTDTPPALRAWAGLIGGSLLLYKVSP